MQSICSVKRSQCAAVGHYTCWYNCCFEMSSLLRQLAPSAAVQTFNMRRRKFLSRDCSLPVRPLPSYGVCPSVRPSVTFVYCIETSKHVLKLFWLSGKPTILVFLYQTLRQYSDGDPHNWSKKCDFASVDVGFISQRVRRKEENLTARIGTSEAEVTNNKRLLSRYCTVEANYRQTVAPPLGDSIWNHKLNVARGVCPEGRGVTQVASTDVCSKNRHPWLRHGSCWEIKIDK